MSNELPKGWAEAELGAVLKLVNGFPFKPSQWSTRGLPIIRIQNLNNPNAPFNHCDENLPAKVRVNTGDLLFAWLGTPGTSFGAHIWSGGDAWLNQHIFRVGFDSRLFDKSFLKHAINQNLERYIAQAHGGAGLAHITKGMFEASTLRFAPLTEQRRIVAKLKKLLGQLEICQQRLTKIPAILKRFRQSVLAAACSGRLTADWREQASPKQLIPPDPANPKGICEVEETFDAAEAWRWVPLQSLCDPDRSICYGVIKLGVEAQDGIPCLRTSDVKPLLIDTTSVKRIAPAISDEYGRTLLRGGEVLVNVRGTLGGVAAVPNLLRGWNISREVAVVPVQSVVPKFVAFWIASLPCQNWLTGVAKGVAYTGINIEDLRLLPVALPSLPEQEEIVRRVENLFELADRIEVRFAEGRRRVDSIAQAILSKAFRGELAPTEFELAKAEGRSFESAAELLERIGRNGQRENVKRTEPGNLGGRLSSDKSTRKARTKGARMQKEQNKRA
jgi:type I restriction enzyme S subunit